MLDRLRDPADPLRILIVTSKLLTGFDAPIKVALAHPAASNGIKTVSSANFKAYVSQKVDESYL
jgi:hypothetical protein